MMGLLFLLTLSYLESDSKSEIVQRLVVSSSLNAIADATGLRHWLAGCLTKLNWRAKTRDISTAEIYQTITR
jgi:hypothetical protein